MIKFLITLIFLFPSLGYTQLNAYDRQELPFKNALGGKNNGFESGAASWTCTPALVMDTDEADQIVPNSKSMATWDSTSAGQNCYSTAVKIPESGTCAVGIWYAIPSGTGTHLIVANDGVGDLATRAIVSSALGQYQEVEFPCTSSTTGNARVGIRSVNANEPLIQADDGYIGRPTIITSSTGTGRNYIKANPDAEIDTSGWVTYADAAGSIPVDGTGGSPTVTWDRTTSAPLAETGSFLLTKDAANRQGNGVSFDFSIEPEDRGRMLQIDYSYEIASGTYATGDLSWHIYDVANGRYIQPSAYQVENVGVQSHAQPLTFQTSIDSTSYRLILHVASTSASAYTAKFDSVKVGPQNQANGPPVTARQAYTPALTTSGGGSITLNATGKTDPNGFWWQEGGDLVGEVTFRNGSGGAASGSAGTVRIGIPSGLVIDTSKMPTAVGGVRVNGDADVGTTTFTSANIYADTTSTLSIMPTGSGSYLQVSGLAANYYVAIKFKVPIVGWSSNVVVSSSANTKPIAAEYYGTSSTVTNAGDTVIVYNTKIFDTVGAYDMATGRYNVKVPGQYRISATFETAAITSGGVGNVVAIAINKNGTSQALQNWPALTTSSTTRVAAIESIVNANAGDYIEIVGSQQLVVGAQALSSSNRTRFSIDKVDGPSQIAATNLIAARYTTTTGGSYGTGGAVIDFTTKDYDYTNSVTTGASWKFTAPAAGVYVVSMGLSPSGTNGLYIVLYKNNASYARLGQYRSGANPPQITSTTDIYLNAGDFINLVAFSETATTSLAGSATLNHISIHRVGSLH